MLESSKGLKIYSILNNKCPVCHEGDYFTHLNPYDLKHFTDDHKFCSECETKFELENGFYYGAMYVSYGLSVAISIAVFMAIFVLFPNTPYYVYIFAIITSVLVFMPISFRKSRMIWMNMFSGYGKKEIFNK